MISLERITPLRENPRVRMPILAAFFGSLYWVIDTLFTHSLSSQQLIQDAFLSTVPANGLVFRLLALSIFIGVGYHIGSRIHSSQIKEEDYESLIQTTHDGFCVIDSKTYIAKVNKAIADILGYEEEQLIGVPLTAINPSNDIREIIDKVSADNKEHSKQYETNLLHRNGSSINAVIRTISLKNARGRTGIFFRDITEQKHTINTLWIKERRYNSLFENMTTGFALLDVIEDVTNDPTDFRFLKINKRFTELTGLGLEVIGEKISQMFPLIDSDAVEWITSFYHVAKIGKEESFEAYCGDLNKWFHISAYRPEVGKVATLFQDITQRKIAEIKLQSERKFLKKLANTSPIGIIKVDANGKIQFANERSAEIMEVSAADMIGMQFNDPVWNYRLHDGSPFPEEMLPYEQVKGFGKSINDTQVILDKKSGERSYLSVNASPLFDPDGVFQGSVSTIEDITERVQVEFALKSHQDLLVSTQAVAKIGGWEIDTESRCISWTAETHRIFDIPVQNEFDIEFGLSFFQGDAKQMLSSALTAAMEDGEQFDLELPAEVENNKLGWIRIIGEPVWEQENIIKVRGIIQDITSRKKIEAEQYRIYTAVEQLNEALLLTDADLNIQYVNRGFEEMTGYTEEGVLGKSLFDIQLKDLQDEKYAEILNSLKNGEAWSAQIQQSGKNGSVIEIDTTISPVYKENSTRKTLESLTNYIMVARDITEKVELEDQLRHAQKMDAIGRLTGSVAHDFNNILTAISGFAELLFQRQEDIRSKDLSQNILNAAQRAQSLTSQLLSFSRKQSSEPEIIYPGEVIGHYQKILNRLLMDNIHLSIGKGDLRDPIYIDRGQFEQIILNLALNAQDAMNNGGRIEIQTSRVTSAAELPAPLNEPPYACISVADEGEGVAPDIQDKIFEPFFTTKEPGKGTGLGLSTVYGIVKEYGGEIQVESRSAKGTRFNIYFPISERTKKEKITERLNNQTDLQGKHILLVDDDPAVLDYLVKVFKMKDCHIEPHSRFDTAVQSFKANPSTWDILISDLVLPEKSGAELARFCKELNPDISTLLITGYPTDQLENYSENFDIPVLQKPFMSDRIMQEIHNILHANKGKNLA